ncbi:MAG: 30S ribosomal protein S20 [Candidatus Acidiferrales bacterium]
MPQGTPIKQKKRSKSVLKNIRQTERRTIINRQSRTRVRSSIRAMRAALASGDTAAAEKLLSPTFSEMDRAIQKKVLAKNTASRYKSRLSLALNSLRAAKKA